MVKWLSQDWLDEWKRLSQSQPSRPGASAAVQCVVTGGPDGDVKYHWIMVDGRLVEAALGEYPAADLTLTQTYADAQRLRSGELDLNVAFMQGRVKVAGDVGKPIVILPVVGSPEHKELVAALAAATED